MLEEVVETVGGGLKEKEYTLTSCIQGKFNISRDFLGRIGKGREENT